MSKPAGSMILSCIANSWIFEPLPRPRVCKPREVDVEALSVGWASPSSVPCGRESKNKTKIVCKRTIAFSSLVWNAPVMPRRQVVLSGLLAFGVVEANWPRAVSAFPILYSSNRQSLGPRHVLGERKAHLAHPASRTWFNPSASLTGVSAPQFRDPLVEADGKANRISTCRTPPHKCTLNLEN